MTSPRKIDPQAPIEDLIEQFRMAAAGVQSAYHLLEQEILTGGKEQWETTPAPVSMELPNLAPLYLIGTLVGGLSKSSLVINQDLEVISSNGEGKAKFGLHEQIDLSKLLSDASLGILRRLIDEADSGSGLELTLKNGSSAGIYDCIYLDNPIEKGRLLLLVAQELELQHLREVENQILRNLTGTLVHEIRTPLTSMQGFAELLLQVQNRDPGDSDKLYMIRNGIDRLNLVATALGTVINEAVEPHWMKVELDSFLHDYVDGYSKIHDLPPGTVTLVAKTTVDQIVTDPELLKLALDELLNNALEATESPRSGSVKLVCETGGDELKLSVNNAGTNADDSDQTDWWVPFYTTKSGHLGLGLVQVRRILDTIGGQANITSSAKKGILVELTLPI